MVSFSGSPWNSHFQERDFRWRPSGDNSFHFVRHPSGIKWSVTIRHWWWSLLEVLEYQKGSIRKSTFWNLESESNPKNRRSQKWRTQKSKTDLHLSFLLFWLSSSVSQIHYLSFVSKGSLPNRHFGTGCAFKLWRDFNVFSPSFRSEPFVEALNFASVDAPQEQSEYALAGLTPVSSKLVQPPYVGESPFAMECKVDFTKEYDNAQGQHTTTLVIARVVMIHVREDCIKDGGLVSHRRKEAFQLNIRVWFIRKSDFALPWSSHLLQFYLKWSQDPSKSLLVTRFGGMLYARSTEGFELQRPKFSDLSREDQSHRKVEVVDRNTEILKKFPWYDWVENGSGRRRLKKSGGKKKLKRRMWTKAQNSFCAWTEYLTRE